MTEAEQTWADSLIDTYIFSYTAFAKDIFRLESLQKTYENIVAEDMWPTQSRIPIPYAWVAAEEATGPAVDYMFPNYPTNRLIPTDRMDPETLDKIQWALHLMMHNRMKVKRECIRSIRDCFKLSVGYGIVEPITVTPPAVFEIRAGGNTTRRMGIGREISSLRYRYVSAGKVIPYPQGVDFNGTNSTPFAFFLDFYPEGQFRKMFEDAPRDGEDVLLKGDVEAIIKEAKDSGMAKHTTTIEFAEKLSGQVNHATGQRSQGSSKLNVPAVIPILKCYSDNRHTWIFAGSKNQIVFDKQNTFDTMRKPLIKWDAWADADRWFPMSQPEADERIGWGKNIILNAVIDILSQKVKPIPVGNSQQIDGIPEYGPDKTLMVDGDIRTAFGFAASPTLDAGIFQAMDILDTAHTDVTGQKDFSEKNFTRGGLGAFKSLMSTSGARSILRHALLQTGGYEALVAQTLAYMQTISGMDLNFERPSFNRTDGRDDIEYFTVTEDDFKHNFSVMSDIDEKNRADSDPNVRFQEFSLKKDDPMFDQYEIRKELVQDEYKLQRQLLPRGEIQAKQAQIEAADLEARRAGSPPAQGGGATPVAAGQQLGG